MSAESQRKQKMLRSSSVSKFTIVGKGDQIKGVLDKTLGHSVFKHLCGEAKTAIAQHHHGIVFQAIVFKAARALVTASAFDKKAAFNLHQEKVLGPCEIGPPATGGIELKFLEGDRDHVGIFLMEHSD